jgi:hypothetical protein
MIFKRKKPEADDEKKKGYTLIVDPQVQSGEDVWRWTVRNESGRLIDWNIEKSQAVALNAGRLAIEKALTSKSHLNSPVIKETYP